MRLPWRPTLVPLVIGQLLHVSPFIATKMQRLYVRHPTKLPSPHPRSSEGTVRKLNVSLGFARSFAMHLLAYQHLREQTNHIMITFS